MKNKNNQWLKTGLIRVVKIHFLLAFVYVAQIIAYDASKLITPEAVLDRWLAIAGLTAAAAVVWYLAKQRTNDQTYLKFLAWFLIFADIAFAAFNVYAQRGMASRSVLLFLIPIIVSGLLLSRAALFATAIISMTVYTSVAVAYFVNYFNEGYKVELYGEILFYSSTFLIVAALLWAILSRKKP